MIFRSLPRAVCVGSIARGYLIRQHKPENVLDNFMSRAFAFL